MKKIFATFLAAVLIVVAGCQKEQLTQQSSNLNSKPDSQISLREGGECAEGVGIECGYIPTYTDMQHFEDVYNCLDEAYEIWNDDFEAEHADLSEDDYNDYCDSVGFEDDQPLIDFENALNFDSYRKCLHELEETWLANGAVDGDHPENGDIIEDDIMATMFSCDQTVIINDTIYWINEGVIYIVTELSCDLLVQLQADPDGVSTNDSRVIIFPTTGPENDCKSWGGDENWNNYANNKKYRWDTSFRYYPWGTSIKGKIKSYKKKNGNWKKYRTDLVVNPYGVQYDRGCNENAPYDWTKHKRRKKLKMKHVYWNEKRQYQSGGVHCYFSGSTGSNTKTLN